MTFFALALLAGLVSALGFAPVDMWPLTLLGLAALIWLVSRAPTLARALALGWWFGLGQFVLGLNWIATAFTYQAAMPAWLGWVAVVLLSLYLAVYPAAAAGLAWRYGRTDKRALVLHFAAAWIVTEWLRASLFTGFAWNPAGVALLPTRIAGLAALIGTYGVSGIAILLAGALVLIFDRPGSGRYRIAGFALLASAMVASLAWTSLNNEPGTGQVGIAITVVQPNIGQEEKWSYAFEQRNLARMRQLSAKRVYGPRLLFWPEAAITRPLADARRSPSFQLRVARTRAEAAASLLDPRDLLLTGGIALRSSDRTHITSATNSIFVIDAAGRIWGHYDKTHLVPYGEYLPARPLLSRLGLSRLTPGDIDFAPGPGPHSIALPGAGRVGLQICYEIIFSGHVVDRKNRPNFLFNPSNDAWFGRWGPPQHLAQARFRAIEEGLPIVRSTPTGISAVIDADGQLMASIPWHQAGAINALLPPARPPTLFSRVGNILSLLFASLLAGIAIALSRKAR